VKKYHRIRVPATIADIEVEDGLWTQWTEVSRLTKRGEAITIPKYQFISPFV
jgi:hypothetical protein